MPATARAPLPQPPLPPEDRATYLPPSRFLTVGPGGIALPTPADLRSSTTVVRAQVVTILGPHSYPGGNIIIVADRVRCDQNAGIDVTGADGTTSYTHGEKPGPPPGGPQSGANGIDADSADPHRFARPSGGGDGGCITIVCRSLEGALSLVANGGKGGDGLNGGDGAQGREGAPGNPQAVGYEAARGGTGGKGGRGGNGGTPGIGGNGGTIIVRAAVEVGASVSMVAHGGPAGTPGQPGARGLGGNGGPGGQTGHYENTGGPGETGPRG